MAINVEIEFTVLFRKAKSCNVHYACYLVVGFKDYKKFLHLILYLNFIKLNKEKTEKQVSI